MMVDIKDIPEKYLVPRDVRDARLAKCLSCEDLVLLNCRHCFCFVHLKTWLKNEQCAKPKPSERKWERSE